MTIFRKVAALGAGGVLVATVLAAPAEAAPVGSCGSGYKLTAKFPVRYGYVGNKKSTKTVGNVYVYYRKSAKKVCAITRVVKKYAGASKTDSMSVHILSKLGNKVDSGGYHYYAGPEHSAGNRS